MTLIVWLATAVLFVVGAGLACMNGGALTFAMPHWGASCVLVGALVTAILRRIDYLDTEDAKLGERNRLGLTVDEQELLREYRRRTP